MFITRIRTRLRSRCQKTVLAFEHHITRRIAEAVESWGDFASGEGKGFVGDLDRR